MSLPAGARSVAVLGAGIVGVSAAVHLLRAGHRVTLIDRAGPAAGASAGNGGVLAASAVVPVTVPGLVAKAPRMLLDRDAPLFLRWPYLPRLAPWLIRYLSQANRRRVAEVARATAGLVADSLAEHQALAAGTPAEAHVVPSDYSYLYPDRDAFLADAASWALRRAAGFSWQEIEGAAFRAEEPVFSDAVGLAVRLGGHGYISDPAAYVAALARHAEAEGARMVQAEAEDIARDGGRVTGVRMRGKDGRAETLACDCVVVALGAWSRPLAARLGLSVPLETERGYHLDLWEPSAAPSGPVMVASGKFVVTPMTGRLRLAGIVEYGGLEAPPSEAPLALLRRHLSRVMPTLRWQRAEPWMGHRPVVADAVPVIGEVPGVTGAFLAFGHHHVGLTAGPKTGRLIAQMIGGQRPNIDLAPYAPARFARRRRN